MGYRKYFICGNVLCWIAFSLIIFLLQIRPHANTWPGICQTLQKKRSDTITTSTNSSPMSQTIRKCVLPPCHGPYVGEERPTSMTSRAQRRFPDALIIGVKKGGTRALINFLSLHPDVRSARRELHFFDQPDNVKLGINHYLAQLPAVEQNELLVEKTPGYFVTYRAPRLIHTFQPNVKLVLIVRDPIERVVSDYVQISEKQRVRGGRVPTLREALYTRTQLGKASINHDNAFIQASMYCVHMANWLRYFPREQIHIVDGNTFARNPYDTMKDLESFLNLKPYFHEDHFVYNASKGFYCAQEIQGEMTCLGEGKGREHPSIEEDIVTNLKHTFHNCSKLFEEQTGMTFNWFL